MNGELPFGDVLQVLGEQGSLKGQGGASNLRRIMMEVILNTYSNGKSFANLTGMPSMEHARGVT